MAPPAPAESQATRAPAPPAVPTPPPAPPDPQAAIRTVVGAYGTAVESQSVDNIRRVYPGLTAAQERGWQQFFQTVRDVKAQLSVANLEESNGTAEAQVTGVYTYRNSSSGLTERQPVAFHVSLRRDPGGWRIIQVR